MRKSGVMAWAAYLLKSRASQVLMLVLALLPTVVVVVGAVNIWLSGGKLSWDERIWGVVIVQLISLGFFGLHALTNDKLKGDELGEWLFQFIVYIPFGMIIYWTRYVLK